MTAIPGDRVARRAIHFPFRDRRRIAQAVPFEVENETPFDLDDVFVDWELVGEATRRGRRGRDRGAARARSRARLEALRDAGLGARVLEVEGLALANLATFVEMPGTRLLVDLGHRKTTLCLLVDGVARAARTLPLGGRLLTEAIARETQPRVGRRRDARSAATASSAPISRPTRPATERALARLVRELVRTIGGFESALGAPPEKAIDEITLLGGGARLAARRRVPVRAARDPLRALLGAAGRGDRRLPRGRRSAALRAGARARAARHASRARTRMNFLQDEFAPRLDLRRIAGQFRGSLVLAAIALALLLGSGVARIAVQGQRAAAPRGGARADLEPGAAGQADARRTSSRALDGALREAQQRADFLGIYGGNLSALDVLTRDLEAGAEGSRRDLRGDVDRRAGGALPRPHAELRRGRPVEGGARELPAFRRDPRRRDPGRRRARRQQLQRHDRTHAGEHRGRRHGAAGRCTRAGDATGEGATAAPARRGKP